MDFVHDQLADGRPFGVLPVVDQWSRRISPVLSPSRPLRAADVVRVLGVGVPPREKQISFGSAAAAGSLSPVDAAPTAAFACLYLAGDLLTVG